MEELFLTKKICQWLQEKGYVIVENHNETGTVDLKAIHKHTKEIWFI